jgi:hypothetical protein
MPVTRAISSATIRARESSSFSRVTIRPRLVRAIWPEVVFAVLGQGTSGEISPGAAGVVIVRTRRRMAANGGSLQQTEDIEKAPGIMGQKSCTQEEVEAARQNPG